MWSQWYTLPQLESMGVNLSTLSRWRDMGYAMIRERTETTAEEAQPWACVRSFTGRLEEIAQIDATVQSMERLRPKK